jgi:malonate transporter
MGPGLALAVLGARAAAPAALIFCCDAIFLFTIVPLLIALTDGKPRHWLHTIGLAVQQIVFNPLIMSACAGALAAALHFHPPVAIDNTLLFLQNAAAPTALFVLGVTVALRPFGRVLMASLPPALNVFVIARQHDTWIEPASVAVLIGTFASVITLTSVMWFIQTGRLVVP